LGEESDWASEASECAADQDAFWEYHDHLVNNQGDYSKDNLKAFADELGLDTDTFNQCLDSGKYTSLVQSQTEIARQMGVQSTPSFIINGKALIGAQPFEAFQQVIDSLLNE
jgi:protein-disulfide isomerase